MKTRRTLAAMAVAAVPLLLYHCVLGRRFVNWDDDAILLHNPHILSLGWENLKWMSSSLYMTTYQPLGWLAYALICRFRGLDALAFHQATLLLHAANTSALFLVILELLPAKKDERGSILCAALAALVWSLHPLQVESFAWATELPDLLAVFFFFLSILAYLRAGKSRAWLAAAVACFLASGLSRWKGVSLPLVLILIDFHPLQNVRWRNKVPFLAIAAGLIAVNAAAKAQIHGIQLAGALRHPLSASFASFFYLQKTVFPSDLMPLYRFQGPMAARALLPAAATLGLIALRRSWPEGLWSWLWYLGAILPTTAASKDGAMFGQDHYAYLALAGFAFPAAVALRGRWPALLLLPVLARLSLKQAVIWQDSTKLWTQAVCVDPGSCVALGNLRSAYSQEERYDEAALIQREESLHCPDSAAIEARLPLPSSKTALAKAYSNMGVDRFEIGRNQESLDYLTRALQLDPDLPEIHRNMAVALRALGR